MVLEREKLYSFEEFWEILNLPENDERRFELDEGVIVEMGASSKRNTVVAGRIVHFLNAEVIPKNLGMVTVPDAGYKLGSRNYRQPDVAFISKNTSTDLEGVYFTVAPDLAVEIASPDEDVFKKVKEYIRSGTRMVWVVYAEEKVVDVFTPAQESEFRVQELTVNDTLDGGDILPGFTLPVRDIFPA